MKKYLLFILLALFMSSCSSPTPEPTAIPTPVGYGVEFPFSVDPIKEWGENARITCNESSTSSNMLDPEVVRKLVAAGGKLDTTMEGSRLSYLWVGNVPLELFVEPENNGTGPEIYYDYWADYYCVKGLAEDVNGWGADIFIITKIVPQQ